MTFAPKAESDVKRAVLAAHGSAFAVFYEGIAIAALPRAFGYGAAAISVLISLVLRQAVALETIGIAFNLCNLVEFFLGPINEKRHVTTTCAAITFKENGIFTCACGNIRRDLAVDRPKLEFLRDRLLCLRCSRLRAYIFCRY